ncbi:hypothetical protein AB3662_41845 [Sorangium cellulosum]|uniref:hypothetical protein n=1 Tax=Sorangium cellulosum TaxID=56 RepID=UPI003D9A4A14
MQKPPTRTISAGQDPSSSGSPSGRGGKTAGPALAEPGGCAAAGAADAAAAALAADAVGAGSTAAPPGMAAPACALPAGAGAAGADTAAADAAEGPGDAAEAEAAASPATAAGAARSAPCAVRASPEASTFFAALPLPSFGAAQAVSQPRAASRPGCARPGRRRGSEDLFDRRARRRSQGGADGTRRSVHAPGALLGSIAVRSAAWKRRVAFHEAGHALVALSVDHADPVHRVTIIPRLIGALGATLRLPTEDRYLMTRDELRDRLCVMLGGRIAEELCCDDLSTGVQSDLERATATARQMVCRSGMSDVLGPLTSGRPVGARFLDTPVSLGEERNVSEETARAIDAEVRAAVTATYERGRAVLRERLQVLHRIAERLLERETIEAELEVLVRVEVAPARDGALEKGRAASSQPHLDAGGLRDALGLTACAPSLYDGAHEDERVASMDRWPRRRGGIRMRSGARPGRLQGCRAR